MTALSMNTALATSTDLRGTLAARLQAWREARELRRQYATTVAQLSALSSAQLDDIDIARWQIEDVAHKAVYG